VQYWLNVYSQCVHLQAEFRLGDQLPTGMGNFSGVVINGLRAAVQSRLGSCPKRMNERTNGSWHCRLSRELSVMKTCFQPGVILAHDMRLDCARLDGRQMGSIGCRDM